MGGCPIRWISALLLVGSCASVAPAQEDWERTRPPVLVVEDLLSKDWKAAREAQDELARIGARGVPSLLDARSEGKPHSNLRRPIDRALGRIVQILAEQVSRPLLEPAERVGADGALGGLLGACDRSRPDTTTAPLPIAEFGDLGSISAEEPQDWLSKQQIARRARGALVTLGPPTTGLLLDEPILQPDAARALGVVLGLIYATERKTILGLQGARAREDFRARYRGIADLAVPVVASGLRDERPEVRAMFQSIRDEVLQGAVSQLDAPNPYAREAAEDVLFRLGNLAVQPLEQIASGKVEGSKSAHCLAVATRIARRIRFGVSRELVRRTGHDFETYGELPFRERRKLVFELERLGGVHAIPALRALLKEEPSLSVRTVAAIGLFRLGDPIGAQWLSLNTQGIPLPQISKRDLGAIYMDQGLSHLKFGRFERAEKEFRSVLEIEPQNDTAWYNLACTYSRWGKVDEAIATLKKAVEFGFDDTSHMAKDPDLDNIREDPRYETIIAEIKKKNPDAQDDDEDDFEDDDEEDSEDGEDLEDLEDEDGP